MSILDDVKMHTTGTRTIPDTIVARNASLGLTIDCETATAHWHGERIDYDHALMASMASWDSGDTRPEAGPATGDWNPS